MEQEKIKTFLSSKELNLTNDETGEKLVVNQQISKWAYGGAKTFWKCYPFRRNEYRNHERPSPQAP